MRIENNPISGLRSKQTGEAGRASETARSNEAAPLAASDVSTHTPSPELQRLRHLLGQVPSIRPEVVEEARQQLSSGELSTPEAARQTARAILQSGDT